MPKKQIIIRENLRIAKSMLIVLAIAFAFCALLDVTFIAVKNGYSKEVADQGKEIEKISILEKSKVAFAVIDKKLKYRHDILNNINSNTMKVTTIIGTVESIIPLDVSLKDFSVDSTGQVTIQGTGDNAESILDFYHSLKASGLSDYITFNGVNGTIGDSKGLDFNFSFKLKNRK